MQLNSSNLFSSIFAVSGKFFLYHIAYCRILSNIDRNKKNNQEIISCYFQTNPIVYVKMATSENLFYSTKNFSVNYRKAVTGNLDTSYERATMTARLPWIYAAPVSLHHVWFWRSAGSTIEIMSSYTGPRVADYCVGQFMSQDKRDYFEVIKFPIYRAAWNCMLNFEILSRRYSCTCSSFFRISVYGWIVFNKTWIYWILFILIDQEN